MIPAPRSTTHSTGDEPVSRLSEYFVPRWYAAQTYSRHEHRVAEQFAGRGVEYFLPLYEAVRRWKDRRVRLQLPLFAGYIFVRLPLSERRRVLEVPSVARLVAFGGLPVALPDDEMERLRNGLTSHVHAEPYPYLTVGRRVRITTGPLRGLEGILLRRRSAYRVVLSVAAIMRSVIVEIDPGSLAPIVEKGPGVCIAP